MTTESDTSAVLPYQVGNLLIDDTQTDLAVIDFDDRLFVLVTQFEKVGSLVSVTSSGLDGQVDKFPSFTTKVLFGKDELDHHAFARYTTERLHPNKPVLFGLAWKKWPSMEQQKLTVDKLLQLFERLKNH